jgi:small neutral amino acid transporter SnatA (MarC family)
MKGGWGEQSQTQPSNARAETTLSELANFCPSTVPNSIAQGHVSSQQTLYVAPLVGCLVARWLGWLVGVLVGWCAGRLVGSLVCRLVGRLVGWLLGCLLDHLVAAVGLLVSLRPVPL